MLQDWGRIAANFTRDQWVCLSFLVKVFGSCETSKASETLKAALSCSVEALTLLPGDLVLPVLAFIETVLPQVSQLTCRFKLMELFIHFVFKWNVKLGVVL